jgi:hypothetical protein
VSREEMRLTFVSEHQRKDPRNWQSAEIMLAKAQAYFLAALLSAEHFFGLAPSFAHIRQ